MWTSIGGGFTKDESAAVQLVDKKEESIRLTPTEQEEPFGLLDLALIMNTTVSVSFLNQKVYLCFSLV